MKKSGQARRGRALIGVALAAALIAGQAGAAEKDPTASAPDAMFFNTVRDGALTIAQVDRIQAEPYRWNAEKAEDGTIVINGFVPNATLKAQLHAAAGPHALDASSIGGGEPEGFSSNALTALTILLALDKGRVALSEQEWEISGQTGSAMADAYVDRLISEAALAASGWQIDLANAPESVADSAPVEPVAATDADVIALGDDADDADADDTTDMANAEGVVGETTADEQAAETMVEPDAKPQAEAARPFGFAVRTLGEDWLVGGNAPSSGFQRYIELHFGVETRGELAVSEAPDGFALAAMAGLEALDTLQSGALLFDGTDWQLTGTAESADLAEAVTASLSAAGIAADVTIAEMAPEPDMPEEVPEAVVAEITDPQPQPYGFAVRVLGDKWLVGGNAPNPAFQRYVELHFGVKTAGELAVAAAPDGFVAAALAGMEVLKPLASGQLLFNDGVWSLRGSAVDEAGAEAARAALADAGISGEIDVAAPKAPVAVDEPIPPLPLPTANPYRWSAEKSGAGTLSVAGYVPVESLENFLAVRVGEKGSSDLALAAGAPEGFAGDVLAGLDALAVLDTGVLAFYAGDWTLSGAAEDANAETQALAALGPRAESWAVTIDVPPPPPPPVNMGASDFQFSAYKPANGNMVLAGDVPAEATRAFLGMLAGDGSADGLMVRDGAPDGFVAGATAAVRALASLDSGRFDYRNFAWSFSGSSVFAPTREAARATLAAVATPPDWTIDITGPTPLEYCTAELTAFDERNAILFAAGSSRITRESLPAIEEVAATLKACPETTIMVEGHTDADGDEESNLILSVSRAEAVVDQLVELGIGETRLYAIGYGESLPVATNDTRAGKQRNRRIVLSISDMP